MKTKQTQHAVSGEIQQWLDAFDADLDRQGKRVITRHGYMADLAGYAIWAQQTTGMPFNPGQITHMDVQAYKAHLEAVRKLKPATINRKLAALSTFCRWAVGQKILRSDPTEDIKGVRQAKTAPKALDRADLNRLVRKAQQSGNLLHAAIVTTLANTGLRVGELCDLMLHDIEINPRSGKLTVRGGKGGKFREVPVNAETRRHLSMYLDVRPVASTDNVFIGQRGEGITPSGVWRVLHKYAKQADVEASPHVLRHTFATLLLREGGTDLVTVADLLGHENVNTTARYTRSTERDRQAAVERLTS